MSRRVLAATLAALTLSVSSLSAQTVFDNGTPDYSLGGSAIGNPFGATTANDFVLSATTKLGFLNWWAQVEQETGPSIQRDYRVSVFSDNAGFVGTSLFSQTYVNQIGTRDPASICCGYEGFYTGYTFSADLSALQTLAAGTYWIAISEFSGSPTGWMQTGASGYQFYRDQVFTPNFMFGAGEGAFNLTEASENVVPEPASLALLASGFLGVALIARRRRGIQRV